ncbi:unnamed protein product [Linum tenue]|uniref:Uncharacterized protein n=1 Tax=Linum tenue TaxID=586396 RepID=A0AAV0M158_9ROSI|nr:unnamed protein product [Linum tenue]
MAPVTAPTATAWSQGSRSTRRRW